MPSKRSRTNTTPIPKGFFGTVGTLFERGLDPAKRSQLGAHYTDRDKIMQIVNPVIVEPLLAEWAEVKAQIEVQLDKAPKATKTKLLSTKEKSAVTRALDMADKLHLSFIERLKAFRALDPACGSGNFLYIALLELKNIEHRVNLEAEALGLPRGFPQLGPEVVLGIELSSYAAELARVSVWIGEIQWMRRNGFEAAKNPILRTLNTIENRDAVLAPDGTRAKWPKADVVIGNPPFLGAQKFVAELGEAYANSLRSAWAGDVQGASDLVCYWFAAAASQLANGKLERAGLVATNSIRDGANRKVLSQIVVDGRIFAAWSDEEWTVDGASVRVSMVCFDQSNFGAVNFNENKVTKILANLTANDDGHDTTKSLQLTENIRTAFVGGQKDGKFDMAGRLEKPETASRVRQRCDRVMTWCVANQFAPTNPVSSVTALLPKQKSKHDIVVHFPAMPWRDLPDISTQIFSTAAVSVGRQALLFLILTAARSGEVRGAKWDEIDFNEKTWVIPSARMKAGRQHRVPICTQTIDLLRDRERHHLGGDLIFSTRANVELSDMTLTKVLRDHRIPSDVPGRVATAHGFRSSFRDWASENGYMRDLAERALAHTVKNATEAAYHRTDQLEQRRGMMQEWADWVTSP